MITETEKDQVQNRLLPYWLFYNVEHPVIDIAYKKMILDFENVQKYEVVIKQIIRISEKIFIEQIAPLDRIEFITVINDQYNNYNLKCSDMTDWLNTTFKLITKGLPSTKINLQSKSEFLEWYNEKIKEIKPEAVIPDEVKPKKRRKTLLEFINNIEDKEEFLIELKNTFPTEIGLSIKAIVIRLVYDKILIYGTKEFKNFFDELTKYFDRHIGTYGSINDYNPDSKIIDTINDKLNPLIIKYKSK